MELEKSVTLIETYENAIIGPFLPVWSHDYHLPNYWISCRGYFYHRICPFTFTEERERKRTVKKGMSVVF